MQQKELNKAQHKYAAANLRKEQTLHFGDLEVYQRKKLFGVF